MKKKTIILLALAGLGAWLVYKRKKDENYFITLPDEIANLVNGGVTSAVLKINEVGELAKGFFQVSNAKLAKPEMLSLNNVKAMLAVIRKGEGTGDASGYRRLFGGQLFASYADHPRILVKKSGYSSTAAGAYQFLAGTWDETARIMGLADFSPANQDLGALGRIAARGALDDVIEGRFETAIKKIAKEWASLPFSPYGQPVQTLQGAKLVYLQNNGLITA